MDDNETKRSEQSRHNAIDEVAEQIDSKTGFPIFSILIALASVAYLLNPTLGLFELLPDTLPGVGNLDEATAAYMLFTALRRMGLRLPFNK